MNDQDNVTEIEQVSCEVCIKEVPKTAAKVAEASDYVLYFCGLECYDKWRKENGDKE